MSMPDNPRVYGRAPYTVAVLHGGPGAAGGMAPVARELAGEWGVLEPLETATSLDGQVEELRVALQEHAAPPVTLIGASWGAMLGLILAARYPALVRKLIMVGSGVYEDRYAQGIEQTRLGRLSADERQRIEALAAVLDDPAVEDKSATLAELGAIYGKADTYDSQPLPSEELGVRFDIFTSVWGDAQTLRTAGGFLELAQRVVCPVVALHGDYDSHPAAGIYEPLSPRVKDFRFVLLRNCGHEPWRERQARDEFFRILREELRSS